MERCCERDTNGDGNCDLHEAPGVPRHIWTHPTISVDRSSKKWACFDQFECVKDFETYTSEADAIAEAKKWFAERTRLVPEIVYPQITRMTMTTSRRRKA